MDANEQQAIFAGPGMKVVLWRLNNTRIRRYVIATMTGSAIHDRAFYSNIRTARRAGANLARVATVPFIDRTAVQS